MNEHMWSAALGEDLTKIYPDTTTTAPPRRLSGCVGERISFQIALRPPATWRSAPTSVARIHVDAPGTQVALHQVRLVPVTLPCFADHNRDEYERSAPGLFPDLLEPCDGTVRFTHIGVHAVWVDLTLTADSGLINVRVFSDDEQVFAATLEVTVIADSAPLAPVAHLGWLHTDCLSDYYRVPVWSQAHWSSIDSFMGSAAQMGVTGVLTPLWTPPLDTAPGNYRTAVQLLEVSRDSSGRYAFGSGHLQRWLAAMQRSGLTDVECPHLFTQWGAHSTPRIQINGQWAFGWNTPSDDGEYRNFLSQAIPYLRQVLEAAVGVEHVWWHISDEPPAHSVVSYVRARGIVAGLLSGAQCIDAVSEPAFASHVSTPVVATDAVGDFRRHGYPVDWVYHCVAQAKQVSNRFIAQPAIAHRILGEQLYLGRAKGFLHWGFNFYSAALSAAKIDPYVDTCAGGNFPGGDPFVVYPGPGGVCLPSLRHRVLASAWSDLRLYHWAEQLAGRDAVTDILDPSGDRDYTSPWGTAAQYLDRRAAVHDLVTNRR